jgi:formate hydrogenlyase subunit 3/multisubunit Na+/H+ antiporter MnhD subunit
MGYIAAAYGAGGALGRTASLYHLAGHALFKSLLFLAVGAAVHVTGRHAVRELRLPRSAALLLAGPFLAGALAIAGMPPFNGFASKALIGLAAKGEPAYLLIRLAALATVASFLKLSFGLLGPGAALPSPDHKPQPLRPSMLLALALLALLCLLTGLAPDRWAATLALLGRSSLGTAAFVAPALYTQAHLVDAGLTLAAGTLLFLLARTAAGAGVLAAVRRLEPGLPSALALVLAAFVALTLAAALTAALPLPASAPAAGGPTP